MFYVLSKMSDAELRYEKATACGDTNSLITAIADKTWDQYGRIRWKTQCSLSRSKISEKSVQSSLHCFYILMTDLQAPLTSWNVFPELLASIRTWGALFGDFSSPFFERQILTDFDFSAVRSFTRSSSRRSRPFSSSIGQWSLIFDRAKLLHSPDEQLTSLAGSFGYVACEVIKNTGRGHLILTSLHAHLICISHHHLRSPLWLSSFSSSQHDRPGPAIYRCQNWISESVLLIKPDPLSDVIVPQLRRLYAILGLSPTPSRLRVE